MTCIAALVHDGRVYMGADSAGVSGWDLTVRADQKVFRNGPFLMGFTTSFRMGQLLRYHFVPPPHPEGVTVDRYMVTTFIDAVRDCLKAGGYARKKEDAEEGGTFLVGYRGRLFEVESDYQVGESVLSFNAVGCGAGYALGAFYATVLLVNDPEARVRLALEAAESFSAGVRRPFVVDAA